MVTLFWASHLVLPLVVCVYSLCNEVHVGSYFVVARSFHANPEPCNSNSKKACQQQQLHVTGVQAGDAA